MKPSKLHAWSRDFGLTTKGVARLIGASEHTIYSWRRADREACEWDDWRERAIAGLQTEIDRLKKGMG